MSNTNFGKKLVSVLLVLVFVFSLISCKNKKAEEAQKAAVNEATELVEQIKAQIFWDSTAMQNLTGNLKGFITKTKYSNVTVSWTSDQPDVISNEGVVSRPNYADSRAVESAPAVMDGDVVVEEAKKVVWVNVTATIKAVATWQGKDAEESKEIEVTKTFKFSVQTLPSNLFMGTIAECKAAAAAYIYDEQGVERKLVSNSSVVFNAGMYGVVTGVLQADGAGQFMIHDGTEGIFVYNNSVEVAPGDQVLVYGEIYSYYGNLQVGSNITVTVVEDGTAVAGSYREVYPQTLEDEGSALNGEELVKAGYYNGELLYVSGKLVKGAAPQGSGQYHISDPFTGEQVWIYYKSYTAEMAATLDSYDGKFVKVRGVSYDRDSRIVKCEILWDGEIEEIAEPTVSDEQKVAVALAGLSVPATLAEDYTLGEAVWEVVSGTGITLEEGVAKVTRTGVDDTVVLKATITIGTATNSKEFTVLVPAKGAAARIAIVNAAYDLEAGKALEGTKELIGVVTEIGTEYSEQYKNITVTIVVEGLTEKPIVCFRMKGEGAADIAVGDLINVSGTIKNYNGTIEFDTGCALLSRVPADLVAGYLTVLEAYDLAAGAKIDGTSVLQGKIVKIDTPYSEQYKNITVTIVVAGLTENPIQCFRLKGEGAEALALDDEIVVTGTIKNYNGTIEFDSGCTFVKAGAVVEKTDAEKVAADKEALTVGASQLASFTLPVEGENGSTISWASDNAAIVVEGAAATVARPAKGAGDATVKLTATIVSGESQETKEFTVTVPEEGELSQADIVNAAYALESGKALEGTQELTGVITKIDTPYSEQYKNITVTIVVEGLTEKPIQCFRLKGDDAANLGVGDTIKVSGTIKNYNGTIEFDANCEIKEFTAKVWTDAEKVAADKEALELTSPAIADFDLPATGAKGSTIAWAVKSGTAIAVEGGKAKVTVPSDADATVVLTATITCGDASDTKELTVVVTASSNTITLPYTTSFICEAKGVKTAPEGWTINVAKGSYDDPFYQSFRNNAEYVQSPLFEGNSNVTVLFTYYLNNNGTGGNKSSKIKVTGFDASGNEVATAVSEELNSATIGVANKADLTFNLAGTAEICQIKVEFVKDGGGNIGFSQVVISKPAE